MKREDYIIAKTFCTGITRTILPRLLSNALIGDTQFASLNFVNSYKRYNSEYIFYSDYNHQPNPYVVEGKNLITSYFESVNLNISAVTLDVEVIPYHTSFADLLNKILPTDKWYCFELQSFIGGKALFKLIESNVDILYKRFGGIWNRL